MSKRKRRRWKSWHLVALLALGACLEWFGETLHEWASARLEKAWLGGRK